LTAKIRESARLRMLVPRIYGLGDLSQIIDQRAYDQAREILSALGDDLSRFVLTDAYRRAARAISERGFVLLLGGPGAGKSTIAAALALASLDRWNCPTVKAVDARDFANHWNPHESQQFFWVDDAFGATQYDRGLPQEWNRYFPHLYSAVKAGARGGLCAVSIPMVMGRGAELPMAASGAGMRLVSGLCGPGAEGRQQAGAGEQSLSCPRIAGVSGP